MAGRMTRAHQHLGRAGRRRPRAAPRRRRRGVRTRVLRAGSGPDLVLLHGTGGHLEAYARDIAGLAAGLPGDGLRHGRARLVRPAGPAVHDRRAVRPPARHDGRARHRARAPVRRVAGRLGRRLDGRAPSRPGRPAGAQHPRQHRQQARGDGPDARQHDGGRPRPERRDRAPPRRVPVPPQGDGHRRAGQPAPSGLHAGPASSQAITNTLVLQDPVVRRDFAWDPAWVGRITAPTLLLWTEHDPTGGLDEAELLLDWLPDARLHVIADAGHWPQWEKVDEYLGRAPRRSCAGTGPVMSEIVGFVGMSHSPFATLLPPRRPDGAGRRGSWPTPPGWPTAVGRLAPGRRRGDRAGPLPRQLLRRDAAVRARGRGGRSGSATSAARPGRCRSPPSWPGRSTTGSPTPGSTSALSYSLTVDHGVVQGYEMATGGTAMPLVPLVRQHRRAAAARHWPAAWRSAARSAAAIRASAFAGRVLVRGQRRAVALAAVQRPARPVGGRRAARGADPRPRATSRAFAAAREPRVRAMGGDPDARVNADWDRWFLEQLGAADLDPVVGARPRRAGAEAGSGGHEIRAWLVGHGRRRRAAAVDRLRAGAGVDHRDGHRRHLRGGRGLTLTPGRGPRGRARSG